MDLMRLLDSSNPDGRFDCEESSFMATSGDRSKPKVGHSTNDVYYLFTRLSDLQKDLTALVLKLHAPNLVKVSNTSISTGINHLITSMGADMKHISDYEMLNLLVKNLRLIATHPSLMVEHFMPTKLLLSETRNRLVASSGKFDVFNNFLDKVENTRLNIIVVGHNIKELDLIEGLIIGRKLSYKRLSGRKLYEEDAIPIINNNIDFSANSSDSNEKRVPRNDEEYIPRKKIPRHLETVENNLYLITTQNYMNFIPNDIKADLIVSFDPLLDASNDHIKLIRSISNDQERLIPIVKIIPRYSIDHVFVNFLSKNERIDVHDERVLKELVFEYLVNKDNSEQKDQDISKLVPWVANWLEMEYPFDQSYDLKHIYQMNDVVNAIQNIKLLESNYNLNNGAIKKVKLESETDIIIPTEVTFSDYKTILTNLLTNRLHKVKESLINGNKAILPEKMTESFRQLRIEEMTYVQTADLYRTMKKLEPEVIGHEKKAERADSEYLKYQQMLDKLLERRKKLTDMESFEGNLQSELSRQEELLKSLRERISQTEAEQEKVSKQSDELRVSYQVNSSEAADLSTLVTAIVGENDSLKTKLNGKAKSLRLLTLNDEKIHREEVIKKELAKNEFLENYSRKLEGLIRDRNSLLSSVTSSSGRSGRASRSSTPYSL